MKLWLIRKARLFLNTPRSFRVDHFSAVMRGFLAFIIIGTCCLMSYLGIEVKEPLYSLVLVASGFYLGHKPQAEKKNVTS